MFSTLVSGLEHCIQPIYRTLVAISVREGIILGRRKKIALKITICPKNKQFALKITLV